MSVAQLEKIVPRQPLLRPVDGVSFLRFAAIFSVVAGHFKLFSAPGAAYFMLALAGFNFARFQATRSLDLGSASPIWRSAWRLALPTAFFIVVYSVQARSANPMQLALLGNWVEPRTLGFGFWFLEVLIQILALVAILFSFKAVRDLAARRPLAFGLGFVAVSVAATELLSMAWDANHLYNRVPHMLMWMFAVGYCLHQASTPAAKALVAVLLLALPCWFFGWVPGAGTDVPSQVLWFAAGGMGLLMLDVVKIPFPLNKIVYRVAGASMFVFLTHGPMHLLWRKLGLPAIPALEVMFALAGGVVAWWLWEFAANRLSRRQAPRVEEAL
jgi:hypothetical protein